MGNCFIMVLPFYAVLDQCIKYNLPVDIDWLSKINKKILFDRFRVIGERNESQCLMPKNQAELSAHQFIYAVGYTVRHRQKVHMN